MSKRPRALVLADSLESSSNEFWADETAALLRRQHEVIGWLENALHHIAGSCEGRAAEVAREALAQAQQLQGETE